MKNHFWLLVLLAFLLAACQSAPVVAPATPTQAQTEPYPEPPAQLAPQSLEPAYPPPGDPEVAEEIEWQDAEALITFGQAAHVIQMQGLQVVLTMKDGRVYKTTVPSIDAVRQAVNDCGGLCNGISVVLE